MGVRGAARTRKFWYLLAVYAICGFGIAQNRSGMIARLAMTMIPLVSTIVAVVMLSL